MIIRFRSLLFSFYFIVGIHASNLAQNIEFGTPPIRNFTKKAYAASPQNWQIDQRKDGMMLFANNLGLLCFNGNTWTIQPINNHTIVRSIYSHTDRRIYVGGQGEFGYFDQTNGLRMQYHALTHLVPKRYRNFADVWSILSMGKYILFQTNREVFIFDGHSLTVYSPEESIKKMFTLHQKIYLQLNDFTFNVFNGNGFDKTSIFEGLQGDIIDVCDIENGKIWVATHKYGIFEYSAQKRNTIRLNKNIGRITSMRSLSDKRILVSTSGNGLYIINTKGHVLLSLNKATGLLNNSIIATREDKDGNLWISSESGIDFIEYQSPYRFLFPDVPSNGTGYSMAILKGKLYLGTNNGLYAASLNRQNNIDNNPFVEVAGSKDICWNLDTIQGSLWVGHNEGASLVTNNRLTPVYRGQGVWKFIPLNTRQILFGAYEGIGIIRQDGAQTLASIYNGFNESSRILVKDSTNQIWMSHPYRGVYKISVENPNSIPTVTLYDQSKGLESNLDNYILSIDNQIYSSNSKGIFYLDRIKNRFQHDTALERIIGFEKGVKLLLADEYHNIWFRKGLKLGFIQLSPDTWKSPIHKTILPPLPESLAGGFEKVFPVSKDEFIFNCESGFLLFDKRKSTSNHTYTTYVSNLSILNNHDSIVFSGIESIFLKYNKVNILNLSHEQNNLRFDISCYSYSNKTIEYRYTLTGSTKNTTAWTTESFINYNNLNSGNYTLKVETRIGDIIQSNPAYFYFNISPAWYNTNWFNLIISLFVILTIYSLFFFQKKKYKSEKLQMTQQHREVVNRQADRVAQTEEELIRLKNEQLQQAIRYKNSELASIAMQLAHKKDFITTLEEELKTIKNDKLSNSEITAHLTRIIRTVKQENVLDEDWQRFTHYFNELNQNFIQRLKEKYPNLTNHDHKLAAYLRMNLTTKEIAALTNTSIRGVEGSRYRLRKKMGLQNEQNLSDIINNI